MGRLKKMGAVSACWNSLGALLVVSMVAGCGDIVVPDLGEVIDAISADIDGGATGQCEFGNNASCDDNNTCTNDECLSDGSCKYTARTNVCKIDDVCYDAGDQLAGEPCKICDPAQSLVGWSAPSCDDGDPCTEDLCDSASGCKSFPAGDGAICLGDTCPVPGICQGGLCEAPCEPGACGGIDCASLAGTCATTSCIDDRCVVEPAAQGLNCTAESSCVVNAQCDTVGNCAGDWNSSVCTCATDNDCDDGLACTTDTCDPVNGCTHEVTGPFCLLLGACYPAGSPHPSDKCRVCNANQPAGWTPLSCDDGDACSLDECSPTEGCVNVQGALCCESDADCAGAGANPCEKAACVEGACVISADPSTDGVTCDDDNACTDADACLGGACVGSSKDCGQASACKIASCDPTTGDCSTENAAPGTSCDDEDACTDNDVCTSQGVCLGTLNAGVDGCSCDGDDANCDDGLVCTDDACLPSGACQNTPVAGTCVITGDAGTAACFAQGEVSSANLCNVCDPDQSVYAWSVVQCEDNNACTDDYCEVLNGCLNVAVADGTACDDGDPCTNDEACDTGQCVGTCGCQQASDCEGAPAACNQWACIDFVCTEVPDASLDGASCDDGQFCTTGETCSNGLCANAEATDCSASGDGACLVGQCDESADACQAVPATNGTSCDDGVNCTDNDICTAGICAGASKDCSGLETQCESASCQESNGQCVTTVNDGLPCDDGDALCTLGDTCNAAGLCVGTWNDAECGCDSDDDCGFLSDTCNTGRCEVSTNSCYADPNTGTTCDDGNPCTSDDQCQSNGSCGGTAYACNAGLSCQSSACDGAGGCNESINAGFCVIGGACYSSGSPNPGNSCQQCTSTSSATVWSNVSNNTPCNADSNGCTEDDTCQSGSCTVGATVSCPGDGKSCTDEVCTSTGANGYSCSSVANNSGCHIGGACYANGAENPANPCQVCNQASPQVWSNKSNGTACNADSNGCTVGDSCSAGVCTAGSAPDCNDGKSCTTDTCSSTGTATYACNNVVNSGKCLIGGTCYNTGATNPGNECQQCSAGTSWSNKSAGAACGSSTNNSCTNPDTCNGSGTCNANHATNGTQCGSTPNSCTNWDTCSNGSCVDGGFKASGTSCGSSADNACTNPDTCNGSGTCNANHASNGTQCGSTPNACTNWDTCSNGSCVDGGFKSSGTACGSSANTTCTNPDTCNGSGTCNANHASNGINCGSTPNSCTNWDTCSNGSCVDGGFKSSGTACGSSSNTQCTNPDTCNGSGTCNPNHAPSGTACGSSTNTPCNGADTCNGSGGCNNNEKTAGSLCIAGGSCTFATCLTTGGACYCECNPNCQ